MKQQTPAKEPGDLVIALAPMRTQESRWAIKCYVPRLYLVWQHREVELCRKFLTAQAARDYSRAVRLRFLRMCTPEETRP